MAGIDKRDPVAPKASITSSKLPKLDGKTIFVVAPQGQTNIMDDALTRAGATVVHTDVLPESHTAGMTEAHSLRVLMELDEGSKPQPDAVIIVKPRLHENRSGGGIEQTPAVRFVEAIAKPALIIDYDTVTLTATDKTALQDRGIEIFDAYSYQDMVADIIAKMTTPETRKVEK